MPEGTGQLLAFCAGLTLCVHLGHFFIVTLVNVGKMFPSAVKCSSKSNPKWNLLGSLVYGWLVTLTGIYCGTEPSVSGV